MAYIILKETRLHVKEVERLQEKMDACAPKRTALTSIGRENIQRYDKLKKHRDVVIKRRNELIVEARALIQNSALTPDLKKIAELYYIKGYSVTMVKTATEPPKGSKKPKPYHNFRRSIQEAFDFE